MGEKNGRIVKTEESENAERGFRKGCGAKRWGTGAQEGPKGNTENPNGRGSLQNTGGGWGGGVFAARAKTSRG